MRLMSSPTDLLVLYKNIITVAIGAAAEGTFPLQTCDLKEPQQRSGEIRPEWGRRQLNDVLSSQPLSMVPIPSANPRRVQCVCLRVIFATVFVSLRQGLTLSSPGWPVIHSVAQAGHRFLAILQLHSPSCLDYRREPLHLHLCLSFLPSSFSCCLLKSRESNRLYTF